MQQSSMGRIAGGVAIVLLLSSPFTVFASSLAYGIGQAVVAVALLAFYLVTNWAHFGQFASRRSTTYFLLSVATGLFLLAALVAVNFIAYRKNVRWDVSRNQIFSLAPQTKQELGKLPEQVRAVAFIPPSDSGLRDQIEPLLNRYQREAPEKFAYEFKDPNKNPDLVRDYRIPPGQPMLAVVRGTGEATRLVQVPLYNGLFEQDLTNAIVELNGVAKRKVYFLEGHGEWPLMPPEGAPKSEKALAMFRLKEALGSEGYTAESLNLVGKPSVPEDAAVVVIAGAKSKLTDNELKALETYATGGGRLLIGSEPQVDDGLDPLLEKFGIQLDNGMLADSQFFYESLYFVVSTPELFSEHPIMKPLAGEKLNLRFPTARGLTLLREGALPGVRTTPLATTSPNAWEETVPNDDPKPSEGEKQGAIVIAAAATMPVGDEVGAKARETRLVVVGDAETFTDALLGFDGNRNFVFNALAWLTDQPGKITIRPPDRELSTIDLTPGNVAMIRFFSVALLPVTLLCIAVGVWIQRRNK